MKRTMLAALLLLSAPFSLCIDVVHAQNIEPLDSGAIVNSETLNGQRNPAVAMDDSGGFFVVWESDVSAGSDDDGSSLQGRFVAPDGNALGGDFQINLQGNYDQRFPDVAHNPNGGFTVVWDSGAFVPNGGADGWGAAVRALRFDSAGAPQGDEFQVNTYTFYEQRYPRIAMNDSGAFVVVWQSRFSISQANLSEEIRAQRYDSGGIPVGGEIEVNTWTTSDQTLPAVDLAPDGSFVVTWESIGSPGDDQDGTSIQARRYDSGGVAVGDQFQVNLTAATSQVRPDVGMMPGGGFVIAWTGFGGSGCCLQLRRYDSGGTPLAGEEAVGSGFFVLPRLQTGPDDGNFLLLWGGANSENALAGRRFASDGTQLGAEFSVTPEDPFIPDGGNDHGAGVLAGDPNGRFVVSWQRGISGDSSSYDIWARRYLAPLFQDDFESGDTSAWSAEVLQGTEDENF